MEVTTSEEKQSKTTEQEEEVEKDVNLISIDGLRLGSLSGYESSFLCCV